MFVKCAAGRLFSLIFPLKKSAKNYTPRRSQRLCGESYILVVMTTFFISESQQNTKVNFCKQFCLTSLWPIFSCLSGLSFSPEKLKKNLNTAQLPGNCPPAPGDDLVYRTDNTFGKKDDDQDEKDPEKKQPAFQRIVQQGCLGQKIFGQTLQVR